MGLITGVGRMSVRSAGAPALLLLLLLLCLGTPKAKATAAGQDAVTVTVEQLPEVETPGVKPLEGDVQDSEGLGKDSPSRMWLKDELHEMDFRPKVRGLKTVFTALLFIAGYLLAHILASRKHGPSALVHGESLDNPENLWLADAAASVGMLLSGLGELLQSVYLRRGLHGSLNKRRRGMAQMVLAGFLYVSCIGATLNLGPLLARTRLQTQFISLVASGLFFWGAALYFDPFGLAN